MNWWKGLKGKVKINAPLSSCTTFKIGGPAKFFIEPRDTNDLKLLLNSLKRYKIPFLVIGGGSNILVSDKGLDCAVIRLNAFPFKRFVLKDNFLEVGSGIRLNQLVLRTQKYSLSGAEFLAGIPGTVGGALAMNAGIAQRCIQDLVENVTVMDYNGNIKTLNKKNIKFGYRKSNLLNYIILSARIKVTRGNKHKIKANINRYLNYRRNSQDLSMPSAGCIFKNPKKAPAGRLIDLCGLKGEKIGDACISLKHANFILNLGKARAKDVLKLMGLIKKEVKDKFNITLESEIRIWS